MDGFEQRLATGTKCLHEKLIACGLPDPRATPEPYIQAEWAGLTGARQACVRSELGEGVV